MSRQEKRALFKRKAKPLKIEKPVCKYHKYHKCSRGSSCEFSHEGPSRYDITPCFYNLVGKCKKSNCPFTHDTTHVPCKYINTTGVCRNKVCKFSHTVFELARTCPRIGEIVKGYSPANEDLLTVFMKMNYRYLTTRIEAGGALTLESDEERPWFVTHMENNADTPSLRKFYVTDNNDILRDVFNHSYRAE